MTADRVPIVMTSRNKYVHGEEQYKPLASMQLIEEQISMLEIPPARVVPQKPVCRWTKPPMGWCMVNTDGSLSCTTLEAGSGYVIRDESGGFVEAGCRKHANVEDPFISELLACREGVEAAARLAIPRLIIQTDCKTLVDLWQDGMQQRSEGAHILSEMQMMCKNFQEVKLLHVGRDANNAAHKCAKEALSVVNFIRFDVIPGFLTDLIQSDCKHYPV